MIPEPQHPLVIRANQAASAALHHPAEGRRLAEDVVTEARRSSEPEALVIALRTAAWAARELFDHTAARDQIAEAIRVARRHHLEARLSEALVTRSAINLEEGRVNLARRDLVEARTHASDESLPDVVFAEALLEERAGNLPAAATAYALVVTSAGDRRTDIAAKALNNGGQVARQLGDLTGAQRRLESAVALAADFSPMLVAIATHNLAGVAGDAGRPVESLRRYDEALELLRDAGLPLGEHYLDKAHTLLALRLLDEAAEAMERAVSELDVPGGSLLLGEALILLARVEFERGAFEACAAAADRASDLLGRQERRGWQALASLMSLRARAALGDINKGFLRRLAGTEAALAEYGNLAGSTQAGTLKGRVYRRLGRPEQAAGAFRAASELAAQGPVFLRIQGRVAAALAAEVVGDRRQLSRESRAGLADLERYRQSFASSELRARAAEYGTELAQLGLRAAVASKRPMQVWSWLERGRASAIAGAATGRAPAELRPLLAELKATRRRLRAPSTGDAEMSDLYRSLARLEGKIRNAGWTREGGRDLGPLDAPTQTELAALRQSLDNRVLVEYGILDGNVLAVVVAADLMRFVSLGSADAVDQAATDLGFALSRLGRPRSPASAAAARLSADDAISRLDYVLTKPLADCLGEGRAVVIVPPSSLVGLPWSALPTLDGRAARVVPSAAAWSVTAATVPASDRVVVVEGPDLAAAAEEVATVAALHPHRDVLVGEAARCDVVLDAAAGAGVVHLACHGLLRSDSPTFSGFQMADGPLTVHDLEALEMPAHYWVLAACDLGNPGALSGPDLEGVLASLLGGGAGAVVAAITAVPDEASARLMEPLHVELAAGTDLAEALARAKRGLDSDDPLGYVTGVAFNCYGGG